MPREFRVTSGVRPARLDVTWTEEVPGPDRPSFRLVRRRWGFPTDATDGYTVVDVDALFQGPTAPATPWSRIERVSCVATNSGAEGGLLQAVLELYFLGADAAEPARGTVAVYDPATGALDQTALEALSRVTHTAAPPSPPYTQVQVWEIFASSGGGEVSLGTVTFLEFEPDPLAPPPQPSLLRWTPAAGPVREAEYHERRFEVMAGSGEAQEVVFATEPRRRLAMQAKSNPDAGTTLWTFELQDGGLEPGAEYYYRLFGAGGASVAEPERGSALATGIYGGHDLMYSLLPPVHRVMDVDQGAPGGGKALYRFLAAFGSALDHFRGQVDGVAARHDIAAARADMLPHLARMIGWLPDLTAPENTQRQDIRFAPEVFGAVGTLRSGPDLVNRVAGWPTRVKEFVHNVFRTNAPEPIPIWEIWQVTRSGSAWTAPAPLALTTSMDGGPVALEVGGTVWVIWHSDRSGRRELWYQRLGTDAEPRRVMDGAPDGAPDATYADEGPAAVAEGGNVRLFWTSDRDGTPRIWTRLMSPGPGLAERLTEHVKGDCHPAVLPDGADVWLFWDSDRRGPRDLWYQRRTGGTWDAPVRLVKDATYDGLRDAFPAAVWSPTGDLWLFWCRDRGDRREIWHQVLSGGVWGPQQSLSGDLTGGGRDESPWPVVVGDRVWLLFHSNRGGPWQIWTRLHDGTAWEATPHLLSDERTADSEPVALVDAGGDLRVFWASQRRTRWYQSRTFDVNDTLMVDEMGTFHDHAHYTYDFGRGPDDWYARDTVGLHVLPDTVDEARIAGCVERAARFLEPFRPAPVRYVWPLETSTVQETLADDTLVHEEWIDDIT